MLAIRRATLGLVPLGLDKGLGGEACLASRRRMSVELYGLKSRRWPACFVLGFVGPLHLAVLFCMQRTFGGVAAF